MRAAERYSLCIRRDSIGTLREAGKLDTLVYK